MPVILFPCLLGLGSGDESAFDKLQIIASGVIPLRRPRGDPLVDAGELRAEVDSVFPLTEARAAFERVAARGKRGKVVLEVGAD